MDAVIITLAGILDYFKGDINAVRKGELKFKSDFILDLRIDDLTVNAKVRASMKDKSYSVSMMIDGCGGIKQATCQCPRGKWICSHMAAASVYVNRMGFSETDLPNSWIARPRKAAKQEEKTISDFFPHQRLHFKGISRNVEESDKKFYLRSSVHQLPALCNNQFKLMSYLNYLRKVKTSFLRNIQFQMIRLLGWLKTAMNSGSHIYGENTDFFA